LARGSFVSYLVQYCFRHFGHTHCYRAQENGQIGDLVLHLVEGGKFTLQYAVDSILLLEHDLVNDVNMKLILFLFEQLSGLKINFLLDIHIHYRKLLHKEWSQLKIGFNANFLLEISLC
jgi:hypothetical protein